MIERSRPSDLRPAAFCRQLLGALEASDGRRKRRHRDTTPDTIGLALRRDLLERVVREDPAPQGFEAWLVDWCLEAGSGTGPLRAIAMGVLEEWRLTEQSPALRGWLAEGAPSDDAVLP